jgi:peptide/nickel transport system permease protein
LSLLRLFLGKRAEELEKILGDKEVKPVTETPPPGSLRQAAQIIVRDPLAIMSLVVMVILVVTALAAPLIAPYPGQGAGRTNPDDHAQEPSSTYWLGTDKQGRDIFSRIIFGAQPALIAAVVVVSVAVSVGAPLGAIAGYFGGWIDEVIMRITDLFLAFPSLLFAMVIVALLGPSLLHAVLALTVSWWPWYTRLVRSVTLTLRDAYFVEAARSMGVRDFTIIRRHILPNALTPIMVQATIDIGTVILAATSFAFLGLGTQPPQADWGQMINEGRQYLRTNMWYSTGPGLAILITVLSFNLLGDTLRDIFDPRQYR